MTSSPRILSWGELLWDLFPNRAELGGCAANVAFHAHQLGAQALLVSRVGNDELGRNAVRALAKAGLDVEHVQVDPVEPTGAVRIEIENGEPTFSIATQAAWDSISLTAKVVELAARAEVLCFGTLAQRTPLNSRALDELVRALPRDSVRLCDLNIRQPFATKEVVERALSHATAVKLNEHEASVLGRMFEADDPAMWMIHDCGVELVALTRGKRGSVLTTSDRRFEHPGFEAATGGDAVGAGDAFTAVLALHLARGSSLAETSRAANRYASHVASFAGAMPAISDAVRAAGLGLSSDP